MNFLAHLSVAYHHKSHLPANIMGEFVKGNISKELPFDIQHGIALHRFIDVWVDSSPLILSQKKLFPANLRRFVPIAFDMFWDHALSLDWLAYHDQERGVFIHQTKLICLRFNRSDALQSYPIKPEALQHYLDFSQLFWQQNWLDHYLEKEDIYHAIRQVSLRRKWLAPLAETTIYLERNYAHLLFVFSQFYTQLLKDAGSYLNKLRG